MSTRAVSTPGLRLAQIQLGRNAHGMAPRDISYEACWLLSVSVAMFRTLAVRHQRQYACASSETRLRPALPIRLLGAEIGFQSFILEALDTPEEIKLITGHADAERVLAGNRLFARGGQIGGNALVGGLAGGGNPGHQIRALYLVQAAGTLDVQRGDAQIPVVVQGKLNEPLQVLIGEERLPSDFRSQLIGGLGEDRALGHEVVGQASATGASGRT